MPIFFGAGQVHQRLLQVLARGEIFQSATPPCVGWVRNLPVRNVLLFGFPFQLSSSDCAFVNKFGQFFRFLQDSFHPWSVFKSVFHAQFQCVDVTEVLGQMS